MKLREKLFSLGYPCACVRISDIGKYRPVKLIITFTDVFDWVRRTPYDKIHAIAIGKDFVNSALNVERVANEDELVQVINRNLRQMYNLDESCCFTFGVRCPPELFIADDFLMYNCRSVVLTKTEYMIFKYLRAFCRENVRIPAKVIYRYCFVKYKLKKDRIENNVAVNVKKVNDKFSCIFSAPMIKSRRDHGYYIAQM